MSITRISRRKRTYDDIGYKCSGGLTDLFDNEIKSAYRLNDDEYDYICEHITHDDDLLLEDAISFSERREMIIRLNRLTKAYYDTISNSTNS